MEVGEAGKEIRIVAIEEQENEIRITLIVDTLTKEKEIAEELVVLLLLLIVIVEDPQTVAIVQAKEVVTPTRDRLQRILRIITIPLNLPLLLLLDLLLLVSRNLHRPFVRNPLLDEEEGKRKKKLEKKEARMRKQMKSRVPYAIFFSL